MSVTAHFSITAQCLTHPTWLITNENTFRPWIACSLLNFQRLCSNPQVHSSLCAQKQINYLYPRGAFLIQMNWVGNVVHILYIIWKTYIIIYILRVKFYEYIKSLATDTFGAKGNFRLLPVGINLKYFIKL